MKKALYLPFILLTIMSFSSCQKSRMDIDLESISGPTWRLIYWEENKVDKDLYPNGVPFIKFTNEGKISGSTGCNSMWASVIIEEANIVISAISTTDVGCPNPKGEIQDAMVLGLSNSNKLFQEGNTLIFMQDDKVLLRYTR